MLSRCTLARSGGFTRATIVALVALSCGAVTSRAQEIAVPVEVQVPLMVKILGFDRNLLTESDGEVVLGVLYQGKYRTSANVAHEVREAVKRLPKEAVAGRSIRTVAIDLDETPSLEAVLTKHRISVLYVAPLRAADLRELAETCRINNVTTVTGVPMYVETGLAIGIGVKAQRPEIVINLGASRAEGADLNAQLLKLARIIP
jgi:hypothetical protein